MDSSILRSAGFAPGVGRAGGADPIVRFRPFQRANVCIRLIVAHSAPRAAWVEAARRAPRSGRSEAESLDACEHGAPKASRVPPTPCAQSYKPPRAERGKGAGDEGASAGRSEATLDAVEPGRRMRRRRGAAARRWGTAPARTMSVSVIQTLVARVTAARYQVTGGPGGLDSERLR